MPETCGDADSISSVWSNDHTAGYRVRITAGRRRFLYRFADDGAMVSDDRSGRYFAPAPAPADRVRAAPCAIASQPEPIAGSGGLAAASVPCRTPLLSARGRSTTAHPAISC